MLDGVGHARSGAGHGVGHDRTLRNCKSFFFQRNRLKFEGILTNLVTKTSKYIHRNRYRHTGTDKQVPTLCEWCNVVDLDLCMCVSVCVCVCVCVSVSKCVCVWHTHTYPFTKIHTHTHTLHTHTHTHTHFHTHTHTHFDTETHNIHTHTHTLFHTHTHTLGH